MQSDCFGLASLREAVAAVEVAREGALRVAVAELVEPSGQSSGQLALRGAPPLLHMPMELPTVTYCPTSDLTMTICVPLATHWK